MKSLFKVENFEKTKDIQLKNYLIFKTNIGFTPKKEE